MASRKKASKFFTNQTIAAKLFKESISLRIKGFWRDAGDVLMKCAEIHLQMKMLLEAASLFTEAAETYIKIDKSEALGAFKGAIKVYCDIGRFDIGGKLERKVAYMSLNALHWEDAALHFRKAANFLSGDKLLDQSDHCIEKSAECLIQISAYKEASQLYQMVARSCVNSNLRRFNARDHLLMSFLCLMACPDEIKKIDSNLENVSEEPLYNKTKYDLLYTSNEDFEKIDYLWRRSMEKMFARNILRFCVAADLDQYIDHVYYWSNVKPLNSLSTILLKVIAGEIKHEKELAVEAAAAERERKIIAKKKKNNDNDSISVMSGGGDSTSNYSSFQDRSSSIDRRSFQSSITSVY